MLISQCDTYYEVCDVLLRDSFQNVSPNHRANDVIVLEDRPQNLSARFMYGPLDLVSLNGEKVRDTRQYRISPEMWCLKVLS